MLLAEGGSADPELNTALAAVIKRARVQGVPKDNVENALKKVCTTLGLSDPVCLRAIRPLEARIPESKR